MIISSPNDEATASAILKFVASDNNPISGGPIINPKKLMEETMVIAILAELLCNLPATL